MKFWLLLLAFTAIYLLFRLPWIPCDPGIQSVWEYGYNATDEGYYLSGGKEKLVWGFFVDLPRGESCTYAYSAGTHWRSEERRVGKECRLLCRSRWSPYH